jgi:hypothetical protein
VAQGLLACCALRHGEVNMAGEPGDYGEALFEADDVQAALTQRD